MLQFFNTVGHILLAILVLLFMVTIHEFGHYTAGVLLKFKINEFAVGFGPVVAIPKFWDKSAMERIRTRKQAARAEGYVPEPVKVVNQDYLFRLQRTNKRGENISLRWFPLGGYCAFAGEDDAETAGSFNAQKPWKRLIVQFSGAAFNIISAFLFCMILLGAVGYSVPRVSGFNPPAAEQTAIVRQANPPSTELAVGDVIVAVDGEAVTALAPFTELMSKYKTDNGEYDLNTPYRLTVERTVDGEIQRCDVTGNFYRYSYKYEDADGATQTEIAIGLGIRIEAQDWVQRKHGFWTTIGYSFPYAFRMAGDVLEALWNLVSGKASIDSIGGPVTTIGMMGSYTQQDMRYLLVLLPLIAVNLGVFNLLPIPALDGARMIFTLIEMIFRKPVPRKIEGAIHSIGLILLFGFVIVIDLLHLIL